MSRSDTVPIVLIDDEDDDDEVLDTTQLATSRPARPGRWRRFGSEQAGERDVRRRR